MKASSSNQLKPAGLHNLIQFVLFQIFLQFLHTFGLKFRYVFGIYIFWSSEAEPLEATEFIEIYVGKATERKPAMV